MKRVRPSRQGFTLIEILIVVVIIGILAATVLPLIGNTQGDARRQTFKTTLRDLISAGQMYHQTYGALPSQGAGAPIPPELLAETHGNAEFPLRTPLGGYWHIGHFTDIDRWGVGIWWPDDESDVLDGIITIDEQMDDGIKTTGQFQERDNARYYWLVN